jgi:selenocysteine lyase/cysteine desulfurase
LEDIKPWIANSHTETSEMGRFSTHLMHFAEESILSSFSVSKKTHFAVPAGFGCTGAMERLVRIIKLEEEVTLAMHQEPSKKKDENPKVPVVFITPYEHHSNILPWVQSGCNVKVIDSDAFGNLNIKKFNEILTAHMNHKTIVITTSAASNVTSQHTNLAELNMIIKEFRKKIDPKHTHFHWNVDGAAFCSHARLDLKVELSDCDSVTLSPHKNLGGTEATGVLLMRNVAYDSKKAPSFPGGGTVAAVIGIDESDIFYDSE